MAKYLAQVIVLGAQVVARAFARALQQEYAASRAAAQHGGKSSTSGGRAQAASNAKMGITLQESCDILNVDRELDSEQIAKAYEHLFSVNDKSKGGSFYLQSKVVRAKERLDEELKLQEQKQGKKGRTDTSDST